MAAFAQNLQVGRVVVGSILILVMDENCWFPTTHTEMAVCFLRDLLVVSRRAATTPVVVVWPLLVVPFLLVGSVPSFFALPQVVRSLALGAAFLVLPGALGLLLAVDTYDGGRCHSPNTTLLACRVNGRLWD